MECSLVERLRTALSGRAVIAGIGNRLRGDDALGPALIDRLRERTAATLVDCAEVPERYLGAIAEPSPESILLIDAVDLGAAPGSAALLSEEELPDRLSTTHDTPLRVLMHYLSEVEATLESLADIIAAAAQDAAPEQSPCCRCGERAQPGARPVGLCCAGGDDHDDGEVN
jgi:hydrogenase maturation protease